MFFRIARQFRWTALCLSIALGGCAAVGPNYSAPKLSEADVPSRWTSPTDTAGGDAQAKAGATLPPAWWTELSDPALNKLVAESFTTSPTLEAALDELPGATGAAGASIAQLLVDAGLVQSLGEARRAIKQGGVYVNNAQVEAEDAVLEADQLLHGSFAVLRRGKKTLAAVRA